MRRASGAAVITLLFTTVLLYACSGSEEVRFSSEPADAGADVSRGFLDPDRPAHNVFGGISWAVTDQKVVVDAPPPSDVEAIASCMQRYGNFIIRHADQNSVSRGSVVATAITESNCSNPAGSSDGLSSGPMQVTGSTCASVVDIPSAECKTRMHDDPEFSFEVGARYMGSSYQLKQHAHDPPKIAAAYNAGSVRQSAANRWHMVVTGNHLERWVGAYNAYRAWENTTGAQKQSLEAAAARRPAPIFEGESAETVDALPTRATEGQVFFIGHWASRDGHFVQYREGRWQGPN
jgi:hypothetical protein